MTEQIEQLRLFLALRDSTVRAELAQPFLIAENPLRDRHLFIAVESIENGRMKLCVTAAVPLDSGGFGAVELAERVSGWLRLGECPLKAENVSVGTARYERRCKAFFADVVFEVGDSDEKHSAFRATNFSNHAGFGMSCGISGFKLKRLFNIHPIMTMFSDIPWGTADFENAYDIELIDVPYDYVEDLGNNGTFTLMVDSEEFFGCYVLESTENEDGWCDVKIRGYKTENDDTTSGEWQDPTQ